LTRPEPRPAAAGAAILVLVLGINLARDWPRDVLDPRLERGV
jgi:ABC-type dipeptide/oligopeptide/nickel transport system permease subunit